MNEDIAKGRSFGCKVVRFSPLIMLSLFVIAFVGYRLLHFPIRLIVPMFLLGIILSPLLVKQYKTGNPLYAKIFGGAFGLCGFVIFFITSSAEMNILTGVYGALCSLFGISVVFVILRKRLIHYIQTGEW